MSVTIDYVDVTGLVKDDLFPSGIQTVSETADNGANIVFSRERLYYEIDLVGDSDTGWLPLATLLNLQNLSSVIGATYDLNYEGEIYTVRFRNENAPVIVGEKVINRSNQEDTDYYNNITIKLMRV